MKISLYSLALLMCFAASSTFSQHSREINKVIPLKADGLVNIDTYKGSISITTHEKPQVEIYVKIEADDSDSWESAEDVDNTEIKFDVSDNNEVDIRTDYKKIRRNHRDFWDWITDPFEPSYSLPLVNYTIKMPATAELKVKDYKSRTRIQNLKSNIRFNTYKGDVEIENLSGGIDLETYKGEVRVSFEKLINNSRFETYKGNITAELPVQAGFELRTDFERRVNFYTNFNAISIERDRKHHYRDYEGKINGGGPVLELVSVKGEVNLRSK